MAPCHFVCLLKRAVKVKVRQFSTMIYEWSKLSRRPQKHVEMGRKIIQSQHERRDWSDCVVVVKHVCIVCTKLVCKLQFVIRAEFVGQVIILPVKRDQNSSEQVKSHLETRGIIAKLKRSSLARGPISAYKCGSKL